ncbi:MAG: hypothetical protein IPM27_06750 [Nitrosomonadales bacterium]|nr:hypothetical protein [Nitrosomonadales bacterium]
MIIQAAHFYFLHRFRQCRMTAPDDGGLDLYHDLVCEKLFKDALGKTSFPRKRESSLLI